jgi:probable F420-dependent oxidoreductase
MAQPFSTEGLAQRGISVFASSLEQMAAAATAADAAGFESVWTSELYNRSATITLAALAQRTVRCTIGSGIMYGVGRTPLMLAAEARDLDELSGGRLILGLGSGTRRMIADWHGLDGDAPAKRMEELVPLLRALWHLDERPVDHEGRFYRCKIRALDPMTEPPVRDIPIFTAGVNPRMIETAGRVADGLVGHTLFTPRYIEEIALPALERGARATGRNRDDVAFVAMVLCAISEHEEVARREAAAMIAFYGSVKTYNNIFSVSGFAAEAEQIRDAFSRQDVRGMTVAVSEEMVDAFAVAGRPDDVKSRLRKYDLLAQHVVLFPPSFNVEPERKAENLALLIEHGSS